ncbi:MAG TPA: 16S rRNA (guanine(966)-N(2))-methyltransferase RsmD [Candidatus Nitrosotalea sp.]|nr:16S rRNA (guanine(966)-N(2))-methyltransferase RsmD [Candidatus Nitrosotalea sp.]
MRPSRESSRRPPGHAPAGRQRGAGLHLIGGEAGGRRLVAPAGIRPTQGLVREAAFDILGQRVEGMRVLDLFAGSGALGLEALSRGAVFATFVDSSRPALLAISKNLELLAWQERGKVVQSDCPRWLQSGPPALLEADLVLLDPPYNDPVLELALVSLDRFCTPGTVVLAEHHRASVLPQIERLRLHRERDYGSTRLSIWIAA